MTLQSERFARPRAASGASSIAGCRFRTVSRRASAAEGKITAIDKFYDRIADAPHVTNNKFVRHRDQRPPFIRLRFCGTCAPGDRPVCV